MALPTLDKTWELNFYSFRSLQINSQSHQDNREMMYLLKEALVTGGTTPWTVEYSCDGTTAGVPGDGIDRWNSRADVSFGHSTEDGKTTTSWIVLKQTGLLANFQLMIRCDNNFADRGGKAEIYYSPNNGFTGGTTSDASPPTATDQIVLVVEAADWINNGTSSLMRDYRWHVYRSSDGACTRIFVYDITLGRTDLQIHLERAKNPVAEWTQPVMCSWHAESSVNTPSYGNYNDVARLIAPNPGGGTMDLYLTSDGEVAAMGGQNMPYKNEIISGGWQNEVQFYDIYPMGVFSPTVGARGRHGEVFDMWWVPTGLTYGVTFPLTPSPTREFMVHTNFLMVHDGSAPVVF